jgi:histidine kinase
MREFGRKSDMSFGRVELNTIIKKAFDIFSQQLKLRGIEVIWDLDENLPFIWGDATRLEQVFVNLLINARDAIEGKWAEVTDRENADKQEEEKKIFLRSRHKNDKVQIEVEDTGKGIDPELIDKIFEPFFTTKEVGKGTGLGLSISYGIINECRGNIRAVPGKTRGACFIITFPVYEEEDDDLVFYH